MRISDKILLLMLVVSTATQASAADAYFVRFAANGRSGPSTQASWRDDILFFNPGQTAADVRVLGVSNGSVSATAPASISIAPNTLVSINQTVRAAWDPTSGPTMWVLHLDVAAGLIAESRDEFFVRYTNVVGPVVMPIPVGKVSMPIFRGLSAANVTQVMVGTDLSGNSSRANVGIYNAGSGEAVAMIELHTGCNGAIVDSRMVSVPANSIVQVTGLMATTNGCDTGYTPTWAMYTTVRLNQPGFSFVSNLNENLPQVAGADVAPIVGIAVTKSENF